MSWLENATPASVAEAWWDWLTTMKASTLGGTSRYVRTSGDGTVYSQAGDVISSASKLANANAWFVLRGRPFQDGQATAYRELCLQFDASGNARFKYSPRAGFVQGSPSPTQVPAASDERPVLGGGTDASPTFAAFWPAGGNRMQGFASEYDDTFWFLTYPVGGAAATAFMFLDLPRAIVKDASLNFVDKDPALLYALAGANACLEAGLASESTGPRSVFAYGDAAVPTPRTLWGRAPAALDCVRDAGGTLQRVYPAGGSSSLLHAPPTYPQAAVRYVRRAAVAGTTLPGEQGNNNTTDDKGVSSLLQWAGAPTYSVPALLDRLDSQGNVCANAVLAIGNVLLGWDGNPIVL